MRSCGNWIFILYNQWISACFPQDNRNNTKQYHICINLPFTILWISAKRAVRILLNYFIFIQQRESHFSCAGLTQPHSKHLNLSQKSISSFNRFLLQSCSRHIFKAVYVLLGVGWQLAWSADWHLRVDRQPPSTVASTRDKCDEQWGRERSRPRDWYRCHRERSEPCLKKRGHRFCCPLNKQRDISAPSRRCAVTASDFCQPLRNNSCDQTWLNNNYFSIYVSVSALSPCSTQG